MNKADIGKEKESQGIHLTIKELHFVNKKQRFYS